MLLSCLTSAAGFAQISAGVADAGTWTLVSCAQPSGQPAPTDGWSTSSTGAVGPYSGDINTCAEGGSLIAVTSGEAQQIPYAGPQWVFTAPAGSTIAGGTLTASLTSPHGQAWLGSPNASYDSADVLANCQYNLACGEAGTLSGVFPITHTGGSTIYATAVCVGPYEGASMCPATGGVDAAVYLSAAEIELSSSASPSAGAFAGTLLSANARGIQELTFTAADPGGPGVYAVTARLDGVALYSATPNVNGGKCVSVGSSAGGLMFDYSQPCRASESVDLPIDTTQVPDGEHTLKVTVRDAAQNSSVVYDATISTENAPAETSAPRVIAKGPASVGTSLSSDPGAWSAPADAGGIAYAYEWERCDSQGNGCQPIAGAQSATYTPAPSAIGHTLRVRVSAQDADGTASAVSPATGAVLSAQGTGTPNGMGASETARLHLGVRAAITRTFSQRAFTLNGRLLDSHEQPIAGAIVEVLQQVVGSEKQQILRYARTAADGSFAVPVPAGPSRLIEVAYRAFSSDPAYTTQASVEESVRAGVKLSVSPRRTTSTGTIVLSGRVQRPLPSHGVIVEMLVHYRGHWEPFRTPRTDSSGRFRVAYHFEGAVGNFPFRAEVPAGQADFPFSGGYSDIVDVSTG